MSIILALKVATIIVASGGVLNIADYHRLTRGGMWKDPIGRALVLSTIFAIGESVPFLLAAFFRFSTLGNQIGSYAFIGFLCLGGLAMYWRTYVFEREARGKKKAGKP